MSNLEILYKGEGWLDGSAGDKPKDLSSIPSMYMIEIKNRFIRGVAGYLITLCEDVSVLPHLPKAISDRFNKKPNGQ